MELFDSDLEEGRWIARQNDHLFGGVKLTVNF